MSILTTLVRKDLRSLRPLSVACALFLVVPPILAILIEIVNSDRGRVALDRDMVVTNVIIFTIIALWIAALAAPAMLMSGERRERSAEFMGTLPVARPSVVTSRLLACVLMAVALAALGIMTSVILTAATHLITPGGAKPLLVALLDTDHNRLVLHPIALLAGFSIAWASASVASREFIALLLAACVCITVPILISQIAYFSSWDSKFTLSFSTTLSALTTLITFPLGTVIALRRVSP